MSIEKRPAYINPPHNEETKSYLNTNKIGLDQSIIIQKGLSKILPLYAEQGTNFPRIDINESSGQGGDHYKVVFFTPEHPDMGELPTLQQVVTSVLMGAFSQAGFSIEQNQHGVQVNIRNTAEDLEKWIGTVATINFEIKASDIQNFTPEFR